jgi:hypothetical protein
VDAVGVVEQEVRELVRRRGLDPASDVGAVRRLVDDVVAEYDERSLTGPLATLVDPDEVARQVYDAVAGFGALQPYLDDIGIEEIWINAPGRVFIARRGRSELTTTILRPDEVRDLVERMLKSSGRRVDLSTPFVDAMLPDGSRLHVVIPDITRRDWAVNTAHAFLYHWRATCATASGGRSGSVGRRWIEPNVAVSRSSRRWLRWLATVRAGPAVYPMCTRQDQHQSDP